MDNKWKIFFMANTVKVYGRKDMKNTRFWVKVRIFEG